MEEKKIIRIIKDTMPSVVSIVISEHLEDVEKDMMADIYPAGHINKSKIPKEYVDSRGMVQIGGGSGFVVDEKRGLILTNRHVISQPKSEYQVVTNDGKKYPAAVMTVDAVNDVAILSVPSLHLPALPLGDASKLDLGQMVIAIGNAMGIFKNTVSVGIVSGLSRSIMAQSDPNSPPQELRGLIQTDAAINPGNSGGPLLNSNGRVIGINAAIISGAQNIGLAIPVSAAVRDLADIKEFGRVRRPYFGVRYVIIDENIATKRNLKVKQGALVTAEGPQDDPVIDGSPAEEAGILPGDIILSVNNKEINETTTIQDCLQDLSADDEIPVAIIRDGEKMQRLVRLKERK
jgi:serine protease Do